jgi:hypothetical protein
VTQPRGEKTDVEPWFADRESGTLLFYRVNRRALRQVSLFAEQPLDFFDHVTSVLPFGEAVDTGRKYQRRWRLGNKEVDVARRLLTGQIGYERPDERPTDRYDEESKAWVDAIDVTESTARAPFVIDGVSRNLVILQHPTFLENTLAVVFTTLLNRGEQRREFPTTEWDVEPILNEREFLTWLRTADAVEEVRFNAKLPNPEGKSEFEPVWSRMQDRKAKAIREILEASDPDRGLVGIEEDTIARAYIAMASQGFGYVTGKRKYEGRDDSYDQRKQVMKRRVGPLTSTWSGVILQIIEVVLDARRRSDRR